MMLNHIIFTIYNDRRPLLKLLILLRDGKTKKNPSQTMIWLVLYVLQQQFWCLVRMHSRKYRNISRIVHCRLNWNLQFWKVKTSLLSRRSEQSHFSWCKCWNCEVYLICRYKYKRQSINAKSSEVNFEGLLFTSLLHVPLKSVDGTSTNQS